MAELNLNVHLRQTIETAYNKLVNDLNALDESQAGDSHSPVVRPAIKVVAECGLVNAALANVVTTGEFSRPTPEERAALFGSVTTRTAALSVLEDGRNQMYAAIDAAAPDCWGETVAGPFGPWTRLAAADYAALHMMYHDGQLNYIHLLHGDTEMHWK